MAARKQLWHPDEVRQKIQVGQLLNLLHQHANGSREMTATQVRATEVLLRKAIPDLAQTEIKGDIGHFVVRLPDIAPSSEAWLERVQQRQQLAAPVTPQGLKIIK